MKSNFTNRADYASRTGDSGHRGERAGGARGLEVVRGQARGEERVLDGAGRGGDDVRAVGERGLVEAEQRHLQHRLFELLEHVRAVRCARTDGAQVSQGVSRLGEGRGGGRTHRSSLATRRRSGCRCENSGVVNIEFDDALRARLGRRTHRESAKSDWRRNSPG